MMISVEGRMRCLDAGPHATLHHLRCATPLCRAHGGESEATPRMQRAKSGGLRQSSVAAGAGSTRRGVASLDPHRPLKFQSGGRSAKWLFVIGGTDAAMPPSFAWLAWSGLALPWFEWGLCGQHASASPVLELKMIHRSDQSRCR